MCPLVLLVDDEETLRKVQAKYLRRKGFEVREAGTGPDGVLAAHLEPRPDVIVMDIMLPGIDGVRATLDLRASEDTAGIPVIASTGTVLGELPMADARFAAVLLKPYDLSLLLETIVGACG